MGLVFLSHDAVRAAGIRTGERLSLEATQMRFEHYGKIPTIGSTLRKLDEALIGTFALIKISGAVQVPVP